MGLNTGARMIDMCIRVLVIHSRHQFLSAARSQAELSGASMKCAAARIDWLGWMEVECLIEVDGVFCCLLW